MRQTTLDDTLDDYEFRISDRTVRGLLHILQAYPIYWNIDEVIDQMLRDWAKERKDGRLSFILAKAEDDTIEGEVSVHWKSGADDE